MAQSKIQVFYPSGRGTVVLRTELDWDRDVEASYVSEDGTISEFVVDTDKHYYYFKPLLRTQERGTTWVKGGNYLATTGAGGIRRIYPLFFSELRGSFTDVMTVSGKDGAPRKFRVYLPPGYDENTLKRYPVLYMHDGSNLFFPEEAFGGTEWQVDENLEQLDTMNLIDKVIVVGVYAYDRMNEYTRPGYEEYGRMLVEQIKPKIDNTLRTLSDPDNTAVMGSSLGGVVSFFLGWEHPDVFGKAACLSSTFGYRDNLMERVLTEPKRNVRFYIDSGWPEDNYENTTAMRDHLLDRGYEFGRDVLYFAFPGALHNESSWAARSHIPFQFFFGKVPRF